MTNLDFRTKGDMQSVDRYNPNLKFADFGTMGKTQFKRMTSAAAVDFKDKLKLSAGWKTMSNLQGNPKIETTQEFYKSVGKKYRATVQIGKKKDKELEDEKWTEKVFTGDNPKLTAFLSGQARDRESVLNTDYKKRRIQQLDDSNLPKSS